MNYRVCHRLLFTLLLLGGPAVWAQTRDSILTMEEFLYIVQLHHPLAQAANLQTERARAELQLARGYLDPELRGEWDQKNFDDKLYWQSFRTKLRVPTALGVDLVAGYERVVGKYVNPERATAEQGLWNVGIEADVLQGLIVNERRIALDRAQVIQQLGENQRQSALNQLLYEAGKAYVEWQKYSHYEVVLDSSRTLAARYFVATKESYESGEYTGMDTLEAFISLQDAVSAQLKNQRQLVQTRPDVENYLWFNGVPLELQPGVRPDSLSGTVTPALPTSVTTLAGRNPDLLAISNSLDIYQLEQRLKRVKTRPKLKIKYNPLLATEGESIRPDYSINDYKFGVDFSFPILLRTARANLQLGEIKLRETTLKIQAKRNELRNKLTASSRQLQLLQQQLEVTAANASRYKTLLDGEAELFLYGESSVFLLNKRQEKFITARKKLIELRAQASKELLKYRYLTNSLITGIDTN